MKCNRTPEALASGTYVPFLRPQGKDLLLLVWILCALFCPAISAQDRVLVGAGTAMPIFSTWAQEYSAHGGGTVSYQPMSTSEGLRLIAGTQDEFGKSDFAAGEMLLEDDEARVGARLLEIPVVIVGIVPVYNVPGLNRELRFNGDLLAKIFLGHVKSWNAPEIARLNPGVSLPAMPITVIIRGDGKGSNYIFTSFLSRQSPEFRSRIGRTASPKWPVGIKAERSVDMTDAVKTKPGAIGYVELQYAKNLSYGLMQNSAGHFVKASPETMSAACAATEAPKWDRFSASLLDAAGAESYPITSFSWLYVRKASSDSVRRAALLRLVRWMVTEGQRTASHEGYPELPKELQAKLLERVAALH
jgi:phosphate transport system substrate-binding protein